MISLNENEYASEIIQSELYLAGINLINKDYDFDESIVNGRIGNWTFKRAPECWMAGSLPRIGQGIPLDLATKLYEKEYPIKSKNIPNIYGAVIRAEGNTGLHYPCLYANPDLNSLEKAVNSGLLESEFSSEEIIKKCNDGIINLPRFIDSYLVDDQLGLNELARVVRDITFRNVPNYVQTT